jgi:hypothetical protein
MNIHDMEGQIEIRASEKRFYQKVRDLFALSSDYQTREKETSLFFAEVQNKLLYAATRQTAAELIVERADPSQPNMALTTWSGCRVRKLLFNHQTLPQRIGGTPFNGELAGASQGLDLFFRNDAIRSAINGRTIAFRRAACQKHQHGSHHDESNLFIELDVRFEASDHFQSQLCDAGQVPAVTVISAIQPASGIHNPR